MITKINKILNIFKNFIQEKKIKNLLLGFFVFIVILYLLYFVKNNYLELIEIIENIEISYIYYSIIVYISLLFFASLLWSSIVREIGIDLYWRKNINIYFLTLAARRLPGSIVHVIGRVGLYKHYGYSGNRIALASFVEYLMIIGSGVILTIFFSFFNLKIFNEIWGFLFIGLFFLIVLVNPKSVSYINKKIRVNGGRSKIKFTKILSWIIGYSLIWLCGGFFLFLIILSVKPDVSISWIQSIFPWLSSGVVGMIITFLPSGLGAVEITLSYILSSHLTLSLAISVAFLSRIIQTVLDMVISTIIYFILKVINPKELLN